MSVCIKVKYVCIKALHQSTLSTPTRSLRAFATGSDCVTGWDSQICMPQKESLRERQKLSQAVAEDRADLFGECASRLASFGLLCPVVFAGSNWVDHVDVERCFEFVFFQAYRTKALPANQVCLGSVPARVRAEAYASEVLAFVDSDIAAPGVVVHHVFHDVALSSATTVLQRSVMVVYRDCSA